MSSARITTAIGTPLTMDETLHEEGLERHLADQWDNGIANILVAGTMGSMQLLTDDTYRKLVEQSVDLWRDKGEIMVGAGDAGFARSRERIEFLNAFETNGVAVLTPYFWNCSQEELVAYYSALADVSKAPLYIYELPRITGTKIEMETYLKLADHPNIAGAKVSCDFDFTRQLIDRVDDGFRVIVSQPNLSDMLLRHDVGDQLDGIWAVAPEWITALAKAAEKGDWEAAAAYQRKITAVRELLVTSYGFWAFTDLMNARGIPGSFVPQPFGRPSAPQRDALLAEPIVQELSGKKGRGHGAQGNKPSGSRVLAEC